MNRKRYALTIERTRTGYCAWSPDVSGCVATGKTKRETRTLYQEALEMHGGWMVEHGQALPEASHEAAEYLEVVA